MRQKRLHLRRTKITRMALAMKKSETTHPLHILRFRANAVMLDTNPVTKPIEQTRRGRGRRTCIRHTAPLICLCVVECQQLDTRMIGSYTFFESIYAPFKAYIARYA